MATKRDITDLIDENGIQSKFKLVFEELYAPLCQYAFTFVKDKDTCEDIVQDIFTRIWEKNRTVLGAYGNGIRYYLFTAVRNNCITYLRREKRTPVYTLTDNMNENSSHQWMEIAPETDLRTDYKARLAELIEQLPPKCKEVFLLARMGQLSGQEVATALGISAKTVENQLWKAMKVLRLLAKSSNMY